MDEFTNLRAVTLPQIGLYIKAHDLAHIKFVQFIISKKHLNKDVKYQS